MYRHGSYGPLFGSGFDLCLTGDGKLNNNYCTKSIYKTENNNLLRNNGKLTFKFQIMRSLSSDFWIKLYKNIILNNFKL